MRLAYLDNLKILLITGVIALHTAITYGFDGSWYLESYDEMTGTVVDPLTVVLGTGWIFGLGLFFLIAGQLTAPSLARKGPRRFAVDRVVRLGIPVVAYTLLISPFSFGVAASRRGWLDTLTPRLERRCGMAGVVAALVLPAALVAGDFFAGGAAQERFAGGCHWQGAAFPLAEGVLATCVSLWALGCFRRRFNNLRPVGRLTAPFAYGAYILHPPVIVGLALAVQPLPVPAELKFVAVLAAGVAGLFGVAALTRPAYVAGLWQTASTLLPSGSSTNAL